MYRYNKNHPRARKESSTAAVKGKPAPVLAVSQARSTSVLAVCTYATARFDLSSSTPRISTPDHTRRETYPPFLAFYTALTSRHPCRYILLTTPSLVSTHLHCPLSSSPLEYCGSGSNLLSRRPPRPPAGAIETPPPSRPLASLGPVAAVVGSAARPLREFRVQFLQGDRLSLLRLP